MSLLPNSSSVFVVVLFLCLLLCFVMVILHPPPPSPPYPRWYALVRSCQQSSNLECKWPLIFMFVCLCVPVILLINQNFSIHIDWQSYHSEVYLTIWQRKLLWYLYESCCSFNNKKIVNYFLDNCIMGSFVGANFFYDRILLLKNKNFRVLKFKL